MSTKTATDRCSFVGFSPGADTDSLTSNTYVRKQTRIDIKY